jgi:hypothetical protein
MAYLEELLPEFRKGAKIRCSDWEPSIYIQQQGNVIVNSYDFVCCLSSGEIISNRWELYQEPIDWDYIIKNKCLCFFWDSKECSTKISCLKNVRLYDNDTVRYIDTNDTYWLKCRPVRRDEVTFYEDKKDEQD